MTYQDTDSLRRAWIIIIITIIILIIITTITIRIILVICERTFSGLLDDVSKLDIEIIIIILIKYNCIFRTA